jgi:hypothetical protein
MRPILQITYNKKFPVVGTTAPTELKPILEAYLPQSTLGPSLPRAITDAISSCIRKTIRL